MICIYITSTVNYQKIYIGDFFVEDVESFVEYCKHFPIIIKSVGEHVRHVFKEAIFRVESHNHCYLEIVVTDQPEGK